jgi:hypothetical protein
MRNFAIIDSLPILIVFLLTVALIVLSVEVGYRIGMARARRSEREREAPIDSMVGSTLGLLAFMLAFTFGMATSRYDARKQFVVDEANAIRTVDLRAQLLPESHRTAIRALLREYVDVRLEGVLHRDKLALAIKRSEELHGILWSRLASIGAEVAPPDRNALATALVELINLHTKRLNAVTQNRIHRTIWLALYALAILAMGMLGYRAGVSGRRSAIAIVVVAFAFSAVLALIIDLDRPQQGLVEVSQQTMVDLQGKLRLSNPSETQ